MGQRANEASTSSQKKTKEFIQSPEQFKEKYQQHQAEILSQQAELFNKLANPFNEEELKKLNKPSLADPSAWGAIQGQPTATNQANQTKVQGYVDELKLIREQQHQELQDLLEEQHTAIETIEVTQNSYQLSTAMSQLQKKYERKLNDLHYAC